MEIRGFNLDQSLWENTRGFSLELLRLLCLLVQKSFPLIFPLIFFFLPFFLIVEHILVVHSEFIASAQYQHYALFYI